jgi:hypothetical protein
MSFYSSTPPGEFRRDWFCASSRFFRGLEKRHSSTMRRPHAEKRIKTDERRARYFRERINMFQEDYLLKLLFNIYERSWRFFKASRSIIEENGRR